MHIFSALSYLSNAVKVNMQGSLVLGKDVMETITRYLGNNYMSGRRSMIRNDIDVVTLLTKSAYLCHNLELCKDNLKEFVNRYIITLNKAVEHILGDVLNPDTETKSLLDEKDLVFGEQFKHLLKDTRKLLKTANSKVTDTKRESIWIEIVKKVCAKFQLKVTTFIADELGGNEKQIFEIKKKLTQKIIIAITAVEIRFLLKLYSDHNICVNTKFCTNALDNLLEKFETLSEKQTKVFIKAFYDSLPDTTFYSCLSEVTANEFQIILNDMHYSENISARNILSSVHKTVKTRINSINAKTDMTNDFDAKLVYIILSDMDYIYSKYKHDPFRTFADKFLDWTNGEGKINTHVRQIMKDIRNLVSNMPEDLKLKLINEVRVFLEITVDPEK